MDEMQAPGAPAGWYADPAMAGTQRYWTGSEWSEHVAPAIAPSTAPQEELTDGLLLVGALLGLAVPIAGVIFGLIHSRKRGTLPIWIMSAVGFVIWLAVLGN